MNDATSVTFLVDFGQDDRIKKNQQDRLAIVCPWRIFSDRFNRKTRLQERLADYRPNCTKSALGENKSVWNSRGRKRKLIFALVTCFDGVNIVARCA